MRSRLSKADFFEQMKKSPKQQQLLDSIKSLTEEDIESCGEPYWIRKALVGIQSKRRAMALAIHMRATYVPPADKTYTVYEWTGPTYTFAPKGHLSLDIEPGNLFYFIAPDVVKVNNFILNLDAGFDSILLKYGIVVDIMTSNEYSLKVNTRC